MLVSLAEEKDFRGNDPGRCRNPALARPGAPLCGMGFHSDQRLGCSIALRIISLVPTPVDAIMRVRYEAHDKNLPGRIDRASLLQDSRVRAFVATGPRYRPGSLVRNFGDGDGRQDPP